jgi:hypothetical protein
LSVYGDLVIGYNGLSLLVSAVSLLRLLVEAPIVAMIVGLPSIALGILGIRLGLGLCRGERVAAVGALVVAALQLAIWCAAVGVAIEHPPAMFWRLAVASAVGLLFLPLGFSAKRNWARLH